MKARTAALLIAITGCHSQVDDKAVPSDADVVRLEAKLARHPCVGDLQQWERNYRYSRKPGFLLPGSLNPDLDIVELHLRRVGTVTIRPGRYVMAPAPGGDWPDSRPIESIDGKFTLGTGSLSLQCRRAPTRS